MRAFGRNPLCLAMLLALSARAPAQTPLPVVAKTPLAERAGSSVQPAQALSRDLVEELEAAEQPAPRFDPGQIEGDPELFQRFYGEREEADDETPEWPDIDSPGPDLGDFPNSAYTLPKGRAYIEFAPFNMIGVDESNADPVYITPFLFRYGLTDDVEFRLLGNGFTAVLPTSSNPAGFSPLAFDLKTHLWDDNADWLIPACSLEVVLQTNWGASAFDAGIQPSYNLNFDLPLGDKLNLGSTVGYGGFIETEPINGRRRQRRHHPNRPDRLPGRDVQVNQLSYQWAVERDVTKRLALFVNGYINGPGVKGFGDGVVVGGGAFWQQSKRVMWFGSYNGGVTSDAPRVVAQCGLAVALGPASRGTASANQDD